MKTPLRILFASCDGNVMAAVLERLAHEYALEFISVGTRQEISRDLRSRDWQLIFAMADAQLAPAELLSERSLAGKETPLFVLCDAATEDLALEAVRVGASEAIRGDDLRRLVPAVARELRTARDISDHRITEDRLRASEQRLMLHIRETPLGAIEWDLAGRVVSWNPSAEKIFGYREREAMNRNLNFIVPVDIRPYVDATWAAVIAQRGGTRSTNRNVRKDGVFIECEWYNTPLIDEQGKTIGVATLVQDVTEHRRNEEAIRQLNMELEQRVSERTAQLAAANKELEAFSYSVSHDLRAPLRSIDGFSKALLEDCLDRLDADGRDYLMRVRAASQRMGDLIDDLLNLSRINRVELRRTRVDLGLIARQIANGLHTAHPDRDVDWSIAPSPVAHGDKNLLTILMENLLSNAFKYTGRQPRARIEFGSMSEKPPTTYYVKDDGAGFDMAHADKLFQPFQRLHHADEFAGHGIGLATVQRIIHRHGGRIWAKSSVAGGACFFFTLDELPKGDAPLE